MSEPRERLSEFYVSMSGNGTTIEHAVCHECKRIFVDDVPGSYGHCPYCNHILVRGISLQGVLKLEPIFIRHHKIMATIRKEQDNAG